MKTTSIYESGNHIDVSGTSLQGEITAPYAKLVKLFGKPSYGDEYKTDAEWSIKFPDKKVATIYNWKNGKNYLGKHGTPKTKITDWHVGGNDDIVVERIKDILLNQ